MSLLTNWEDLRKHARQLENAVDVKLVSLNKLGLSMGKKANRIDLSFEDSEKALMLSSDSTLDSLCAEIQDIIAQLSTVNERLAEVVNACKANSTSNPAMFHTLQRHREILHDYSQEFLKTRSNLEARREREALLDSTERGLDYKSGINNRSKSDLMLKEHEHIRSSDRLVDDQINLVMHLKENLQNQHFGIRGISRKVNALTKKYPALNSLMQKIHVKKRRDTVVIGSVIALCLLLLFIYATR